MHADVPLLTYTDFGQNMGRFSAGPTNALLTYIRQQEGGVVISTYTGGQPPFTMPHGMIDFSSQNDGGYGAAIGYNWYSTVEHNGVHNNTYVGNFIGGAGNAVHYVGIEYRQSQNNIFRHVPNYDYKITRQSKLLTDVTGSTVYGTATGNYSDIYNKTLAGQLLYRAGSGKQAYFSYDGVETTIAGGYITGSVAAITSVSGTNSLKAFTIYTKIDPSPAGVNASNPLPYVGRGGDSGSPAWAWNDTTQQYEYIAAAQGVTKDVTYLRGASEWTQEVMDSYNVTIDMPTDSAVHIQGIYRDGETLSDSTNGVSTTLHYGKLTDGQGHDLVDSEGNIIEYRGVQTGINTWRDLSGIKDQDKWYAYGANYLNSTSNGQGADMNYADLYNTDNLVFVAHSSQEQLISVDANIDLGLGYVHLRKAEDVDSASFSISSANQGNGVDFLLNSAGYVVDEGVSLHLQLTNPADYMREWRKIGEGDLYIEGSGDNNILLNLGGNGTTYLQRENGYSAYNVLANNGTRVVIKDVGQIKRDFTFGFRGGVLDMNGQSMTWNNDNKPEAEGYDPTASGFAIHALDEHAIISNASGKSTLTWTQGGDQKWLGSFTDTSTGSLKFIYDGGAGSTLTMHSIHTNLTNHTGSGIEVASGTVRLVGTNTLHSMYPWQGAVNGRYFNKDDWHYADSAANIAIRNGGVFELGSHARLTGNITVESGGTFVIREGVKQQYEYLEGGYTPEDTYKYRDFYGLKGNIATESGATVRFAYSEGTASANVYSGNITGAGNVEIDLGVQGGALALEGSGSNYSGEKLLASGTLIATVNNALGSVAGNGDGKWKISEKGVLASHGFVGDMGSSDIMAYIDASSSGVLALTADRAEQLDKAGQYGSLYIGALSSCNVSYGTLGTAEALTAYSYGADEAHDANITGYWRLGGGGGNLTVNFRLTGDNDLILGNDYGKGGVTLTNVGNDFTGSIIFNGAITLHYEDERVLGKSIIKLDYSTRVPGETRFDNLVASAEGVVLVTENSQTRDFDFTTHKNVSIASDKDLTFTGSITLAADADYHFGGGSGTLAIASDLNAGHNLIIDAQTYTGGTIILNDLADISGNVLISGYNEDRTALREGDVTLKLLNTQTDVFKDNDITLKHGGIIDIAGTTQTFVNLGTEEGSLLRSSAEGAAGTVVLMPGEGQTMHLAGSFDVADIAISGQGTVELGGTNSYSDLRMQSGTVTLISDGALSGHAAWLEKAAALNLNAHTVAGNLFLEDGASVNASVAGSGVAAGGAIIAAQGTGHIQTAGTPFTVRGDVGAAEGATLELHGNAFTITGESINSSGGTLSFVDSSTINLATATQTFGGTFRVAGGTTITNAGHASTYSFDTLHIDGSNGKNVTFTTNWVLGWSSSVLTVEHLDGDGFFTWDPSCYSTGSSRTGLLKLTGEGQFSGTMRIKSSGWTWGALSRYAELTHDKALQNATVDLLGINASHQVALAVNTGNAQFKGLTGNNAYAYVYAGAASGSTNPAAPISTRKSTLTFTGDGAYEFLGSVGVNDGGTANGLSLVMAGSGTQSFKGGTIIVNNVEVQKGTLKLEASNILNVRGDISVTQGAELVSGKALTLDEGKTIFVQAGDSAQPGAATISAPSLTLAGGILSFSAKTFFDESTASLQGLQSVLAADGTNSLVINIVDTSSLGNRSYLLASGDWSALASGFTFTTSGLDYLTATYTASSNGLLMALSTKDNHFIWNGADTNHSWTDTLFDVRQLATGTDHTVIFNDTASRKDVEIGSDVTAGSILFDNSAGNNYTLAAAAGNVITANNVTQRGNGNTVVDAALTTGTLTVENGLLQLKQAVEANALSIQNNGALEATGPMTGVASLGMSGNSALRFIGTGKGSLTLSSLTLAGGGSMSIGNANIAMSPNAAAANRYFTANTTLTLTDSVLDDRLSSWRMANATFSLAGNGTLFINRLRLSDQQSSTISTLNIGSGFSLVITGESAGTTQNADGNFALSLWATPISGGNVVNIEGSLTSNAPVAAWDSAATINIREGGTLNLLKGLVRNTGRSHAITINAENGSRLNVGNNATGNNLTADNLPVNLLSGSTLGAIGSNVTVSKSFTLGSADSEGVVTIDTNYSTVANDGSLAVQQGDAGGVITLSGNISSYNTASLAIVGKGEVISSNALAIGHDLLVQDTATLAITGAVAVNGGISVATGATLQLNGATLASDLTLSSGTLGISGETHLNGFSFNNSGAISLADDTRFDLNLSHFTLNDDGTYTYVFSRGAGAISHSDSLSLSDIFVVNGSSLSAMGEGQYAISRDNGLAITISIKEINWAGRTGHTWETENAAWQREDNGANVTFHNMDTVTFGLNVQQKAVSLAGDKLVNHMQVEAAGYSFEGSGHTISVAGNLTLTQEATQTSFNTGLAVDGNVDIAGEATFLQAVSVGGLLTVSGTATFNNQLSAANPITVTGKLGMAATANTNLAYRIDASEGTLSFDTQRHTINYNSGSLRAGSLQITGGGSFITNLNNLSLPNIELGADTTLKITNNSATNGATKLFGNLSMGDGAVLAIHDAQIPTAFTTIGKIALSGGTATITDTNHSGYNHINALSGTGTLQFHKAAMSTHGSVYELGSADVDPGDFSGNIILRSIVPDNSRRSATLVISNSGIAKNAIVTLDTTNSGNSNSVAMLGLGIHADTVTLAGLASNKTTGSRAIVYSGTLGYNSPLNRDDAGTSLAIGDTQTLRTLVINTAADAAYTYYGRVLGNLNIVKRGDGTQAFAGASADFNGSISVEGGSLAFNAASKDMLSAASSVTVGSGATLDLSAIAFDKEGTQTIAISDGSTVSFAEGSTLNLKRLADGAYQIFQPGANGGIEGWQSLSITMGGSDLTRKIMDLTTNGVLVLSTDKLLWRGAEGASWTADEQQNWLLQSNRSATSFYANDSVVFDADAATSRNVVVGSGGVTAESISVMGEGYAFSGGLITVTDNVNIAPTGSATFAPGNLAVGGTLTVEGTLTFDMDSDTALSHNIDASNGGTVIFDTASAITYNSGSLKAANLQLTGGSLSTSLDVNLASVTLGTDATLTLESLQTDSGQNKTIGTVSMGNGSTLEFKNDAIPGAPVTIGGIALNGGTAKLTDTTGFHAASIHIETLSGSGTLNLTKNASSSHCTVYDLGSATASGGGDDAKFSGTISVNSNTPGNNRPTVLTISNGDIASHAVIHLGTAADASTYLGLGIHADHTAIAGLTSDEARGDKAVLFSGGLSDGPSGEFNASAFPTADAIRTLEIATTANANYVFNGQVLGGLNLEKSGAGSQTFAGSATLASVNVQGGTLAFTGSLTVSDTMTVGANGNLSIGGALAFGSAITNAGTVTLQTGASIALDRSAFRDGAYTIVDGGTVVAAENDFASKFTIDGSSLANLASSQYSFDTAHGGLTITLNGFWAGTETQYTWSGTQFGPRTYVPGINDTVFFTDAAANKNVSLASDVHVHHAEFDSSQNYRLTANGSEKITADKISQLGSGEALIDATVNARDVVVEQGALSLDKEAYISGALTIANGAQLSVAQADIHALTLGQNGAIGSANGELASANVENFAFTVGGTANIDKVQLTVQHGSDRWLANTTQTINLTNDAVLDDRNSKYRVTGGTINITGGGTMYVKGIRLNDNGSSTTTLNVATGTSLIITGSATEQDGDFSLSHWGTRSAMNIAGTITSNAIISSWDANSSSIAVLEGGSLNLLKGLIRNSNRSKSLNLSVASGARLNAAGGTQNNSLPVTLQAGSTLGAIGEDVTYTNNFTLGENDAVTIDTTYSAADDNFIVTQGTEGGTITLSGTLTAEAGTTLAIAGNGTAKFTGNSSSSFAGDIEVLSGATLAVSDSGKNLITAADKVTIGSGATFDLSSATFNDTNANAISLAAGHTFTFNAHSTLNLGELDSGTYWIFNTENGGQVNWTNLTRENLTLAGQAAPSRAEITFNGNGSLTISLQKADLVWNNNTGNSMWDYTATNWQHSDDSVPFDYRDSVRFESDATGDVKVASDILVANVTFDAGSNVALRQQDGHTLTADTLTINGTLSTDFGLSAGEVGGSGKLVLLKGARQDFAKDKLGSIAGIEVQEGATLAISDTNMGGFAWNNATTLEGQGTVEVSLSGTWGNTINVFSANFTGTTYVKSGNFTISNAVVGSALRMANGVNMQLTGNTTFVGNLILDGDTEVHQNGSANFTVNGSLTGTGTYDRRSGGTLTINGKTDLANFLVGTPDGAKNIFNGETTLGNLTISKSRTNVEFTQNAAITNGIAVHTGTGNTVRFLGDTTSVKGDVALSGNDSSIQFASSTIRANVSANIRNATIAAEKAKSEAARSLLKIQGDANHMATVDGAGIDLAEATNLELENAVIGAGTTIAGAGAERTSIVFNNVTMTLPNTGAAPAALGDLSPLAEAAAGADSGDMWLTQTGTAGKACFIPAGTECYAIAAANLAAANMKGSSLTFDVSAYAAQLEGRDLFSIVFADGVTIDPSLAITATTGTHTFAGFYDPNASGAPVVYFGKATENVPEPATATLGLLALAALAARRRRRG